LLGPMRHRGTVSIGMASGNTSDHKHRRSTKMGATAAEQTLFRKLKSTAIPCDWQSVLTPCSAAEDECESAEADATETDRPGQTGTARAGQAPGRRQGRVGQNTSREHYQRRPVCRDVGNTGTVLRAAAREIWLIGANVCPWPMDELIDRKECDPGLEEAVKTIIYAAPRSESKELQEVRNLLTMRFGHAFAQTAIDNTDNKVSPRVLSKLGVDPPSATLVTRYLREIARTYNVEWGQESDGDDDSDGGGGIAALEPPLEAELSTGDSTRREPIAMAPPSPTSENLHPHIKLPPNTLPAKKPEPKPKATGGGAGGIAEGIPKAPSLDDLMSRFEALKKR